jgi:hypothetical protein
MRKKTALWAAVALAVTIPAAIIWHFGRVETVPASLQEGWKPEPPEGYSGAATIWISCEKGTQFGWTSYPVGGVHPGKTSDLAPEPAMFAHCRPDEDFTYDVQSTESEITESKRRPEVSFVLTDAGLVRDAFIGRSSGSKSLDQKVLAIVVSRKYEATGCGSCRVFVAPPVNLKKATR